MKLLVVSGMLLRENATWHWWWPNLTYKYSYLVNQGPETTCWMMMLLLADFFHENNVGYLPFLGGTLIDVTLMQRTLVRHFDYRWRWNLLSITRCLMEGNDGECAGFEVGGATFAFDFQLLCVPILFPILLKYYRCLNSGCVSWTNCWFSIVRE